MNFPSSSYPLNGFIFTKEGTHNGSVTIGDQITLRAFLFGLALPALEEGREAMITDVEDYAVLHFKEGRVLWPKESEANIMGMIRERGPIYRVLLNNKFYTHKSSQREADKLADLLFSSGQPTSVEVIGKTVRGAYYYRLLQKT